MTRMFCLCVTIICGFTTLPIQANSLLKSVPTGSWGGEHIRMIVTKTGAKIEYDCALGTIDEALLLDKDGNAVYPAREILPLEIDYTTEEREAHDLLKAYTQNRERSKGGGHGTGGKGTVNRPGSAAL